VPHLAASLVVWQRTVCVDGGMLDHICAYYGSMWGEWRCSSTHS